MAGRIRLGMVGGGQGALIGAVHRIAARMDDQFELVAGALSSNAERAQISAAALGLDPDRSYSDFRAMAKAEGSRPDGIEAVSIVTPNHMHADPIIAFLEEDIHVVSDKPLASTVEDAQRIEAAVAASKAQFVLTHNYTGYPLIRNAKRIIDAGEIGAVRIVQVEYAQDWLAEPLEASGNKQATWRTDPAKSGAGGAIGDIGTHAFNLLSFVTGLKIQALAADSHCFVEGRRLDDNAHIMLRLEGGAKGMIWASQVAVGCENGLRLRIFGETGSLEWAQENPNELHFATSDKPRQVLTRGGKGLGDLAANWTRIPPGHPEGYLEGFSNIYNDAAKLIRGEELDVPLPGIHDGISGMAFINACISSSASDGEWTTFT